MTAAVLVLGATGGQGGAVTAALLARGTPVRALVRNPRGRAADALARRGVDLATGDLTDEASLTAAMRGASAVFAVTTPFEAGPDAETEQGLTLVRAAGRARVPHLVYSSVAGADRHSGVPHFESKAVVERALEHGDVPFTVLGPTYFFDNLLGVIDEVLAGILELPLPHDFPLQQVARQDLGEVAAEVLTAPSAFAGRRIEIAGDAISADDMAAVLSGVLGRAVEVREVPLELVRRSNPDMGSMWTFIADGGYAVDIERLHREFPSVQWTSFSRWAADTLAARVGEGPGFPE
jgi:uncharacterized protein YbjT (DUF2867 family)